MNAVKVGKIRITEAQRQENEQEAREVLDDISRWGTRSEIEEAKRELRYWSDRSIVTER